MSTVQVSFLEHNCEAAVDLLSSIVVIADKISLAKAKLTICISSGLSYLTTQQCI